MVSLFPPPVFTDASKEQTKIGSNSQRSGHVLDGKASGVLVLHWTHPINFILSLPYLP